MSMARYTVGERHFFSVTYYSNNKLYCETAYIVCLLLVPKYVLELYKTKSGIIVLGPSTTPEPNLYGRDTVSKIFFTSKFKEISFGNIC
jgi:hypothetical protein